MSLREEWPSLSPRERDARVGEALGLSLWSSMIQGTRFYLVLPRAPGPGWLLEDWSCERGRDVAGLRRYSATWEHAGPLLDKLREDEWTIDIQSDRAWRVHLYHPQKDEIHTQSEGTACGAIALAFCLSREASDTAEPSPPAGEVVDLMAAIKASIAAAGSKK